MAVKSAAEEVLGTDLDAVQLREHPPDQWPFDKRGLAVAEGETAHFRAGALKDRSDFGRRLLGHELTHLAQQSEHGQGQQYQFVNGIKIPDVSLRAGDPATVTVDGVPVLQVTGQNINVTSNFDEHSLRFSISVTTDGETSVLRDLSFLDAMYPSLRGSFSVRVGHTDLVPLGRPLSFGLAEMRETGPITRPEMVPVWVGTTSTSGFGKPQRKPSPLRAPEATADLPPIPISREGLPPRRESAGPREVTPLRENTATASVEPNDLDLGMTASAFGATVAKGLLVIGIIGLAVGAEIITAGAATGLLIGLAGVAGVSSYLSRRQEIEEGGYDVPIPETILDSAGDVVGVSQVIEGISGERLGTSQRLTTAQRSEQLGEGAGSIALLLGGSRAYRAGQSLGQARLAGRVPYFAPKRPPRLEPANELRRPPVELPPETTQPALKALRESLPPEDRVGFDALVQELVAKGKDPQGITKRPEAILRKQAHDRAQEISVEVRARSGESGNPLDPQLRHSEQRGNIRIRYETREPSGTEIAQGQALAREAGFDVELFGNTPAKVDFPGIDGILKPGPRPLSLKQVKASTPLTEGIRGQAASALEKAATEGYTGVQVHIWCPTRTVAEIRAAWNSPLTGTRRPIFNGNIVTRIIIQGMDGLFIVLPGPALPGVRIPFPTGSSQDDGTRNGNGGADAGTN